MSNDRYANIRRALESIQASARGHRHKRDLAHLDFREACDPDTIRELLAEHDQLAAALEAAREDAERYRWLRCEAARHKAGDDPGALRVSVTYNPKRSDGNGFTGMLVTPMGDDFDAAIDQARGKGGGEVGP